MSTKSELVLTSDQKLLLLNNLARAVSYDQMMMRVILAGKMVGFYHEGGIALAPGVAAASFLRDDDFLAPHYRAHGIAHMLAKGIDIKSYVAEHTGRETGCCEGRSSSHYSFPESRVFGCSGNIAANLVTSLGYGYAARLKGSDQVVMACSGDGSYGEGRAHEALVMAANWQLPMIFWCENNGMSQYSPIDDIFPRENCSELAAGYGIPSLVVDGQDLFACAEAALQAIEHTRAGNGPIFVECMTLRAQEHAVGGFNKAGAIVRDQALMDQWKTERDPLRLAFEKAVAEGLLSDGEVQKIRDAAEQEAAAAEAFAEAGAVAQPSIDDMLQAVYAD